MKSTFPGCIDSSHLQTAQNTDYQVIMYAVIKNTGICNHPMYVRLQYLQWFLNDNWQ